MATKTARFWADDNGMICCEDHAGMYLTHCIEAQPKARVHRTPRGTYELMTKQDVIDFQAFIDARLGGGSICEICRDQK